MTYRLKLTKDSNFKGIAKDLILDKGGFVSFNWRMERCGRTTWWTCSGYIGDNPIKIVLSD